MKERFKALFDEWYHQLVVYAKIKGLCEADAKDIAEEAFIRLWTKGQDVMEWDHPRKWLYVTVRNLIVDHYRLGKKTSAFNEEAFYLTDECDQIETHVLADAWSSLSALPGTCRKVIELYLIGKKTSEIMAYLGISQQNVLNQKTRGIKLLKEKLLKTQ